VAIVRFVGVVLLVAFSTGAPRELSAQEPGSRYTGDIRDLRLGLTAETMPEGYFDFACGTNGGPPSQPIEGWADFARCRPEPSGLREVYVTFDDEWAEIARANPDVDLNWVHQFSGTVIAGFPVIVSVLFDEAGVVRGIRAVTDPRASVEKRSDAYLFSIPINRRFGSDGWACEDLPRETGETEIGGMFIKRSCRKLADGRELVIETHFYRRRGQTGFDFQGQFVEGEFESTTRFEIWDPAYGPGAAG
jgi:hypothetical protein